MTLISMLLPERSGRELICSGACRDGIYVFCAMISGWEQAHSIHHMGLSSSILENCSDLTIFQSFQVIVFFQYKGG